MNNGAFGENFPYSNFHDLNMDWIIKIAKDFLDQYTHIQQIIADGEQSIQNLTEEGLQDLTSKANELQALLQDWYDSHSQDIADQLADALTDLNKWYSTHENYLNQILIDNIASFNLLAEEKTEELIKSIPSTYTELEGRVDDIEDLLDPFLVPAYNNWTPVTLTFARTNGYWQEDGVYLAYDNMYKASIVASAGQHFKLSGQSFWASCTIVFKNGENFVSGIQISNSESTFTDYEFTVPANTTVVEIYRHGTTAQFSCSEGSKAEAIKINSNEVYYKENTTIDTIFDDCTSEKRQTITTPFVSKEGYYEDNGTYYRYDNIYALVIPVTPGDKYYVSGFNYYAMAPICFLNGSAFVSGIKYAYDTNAFSDTITIPNNATAMRIQKYGQNTVFTVQKYTGLYKFDIPVYKTASILKNKKLTLIGDSITEHNFRALTNWAMWINQWTGASIQNLGISGTGFCAGHDNNSNYINRISSIQQNPDIIGVAISFNDTYAGLPIGTKTDTGTTTVAGYINDFFTALLTAYPTTPIICYCQCSWGNRQPGVQIGDEYVEVLKEICALIQVPFYYDMYYGSVLKPKINSNKVYYYTSDDPDHVPSGVTNPDDTHPNSEGHKAIARYLYPKFASNLVTTGLDY